MEVIHGVQVRCHALERVCCRLTGQKQACCSLVLQTSCGPACHGDRPGSHWPSNVHIQLWPCCSSRHCMLTHAFYAHRLVDRHSCSSWVRGRLVRPRPRTSASSRCRRGARLCWPSWGPTPTTTTRRRWRCSRCPATPGFKPQSICRCTFYTSTHTQCTLHIANMAEPGMPRHICPMLALACCAGS